MYHPRDPQFLLWDTPIKEWVARQGIIEYDKGILPTDFDDIHIPENFPKVRVLQPAPGQIQSFNQPIRIEMEIKNVYPITKVEFYLNETILGEAPNSPGSFSFLPSEVSEMVREGENQLSIVVEDSVFNETKVEIILDIRKI